VGGVLLGVTGGTCQSTGNPNTRKIQHTVQASNVSMPTGWSYGNVNIPEVEVYCLSHHDVNVQNITFYDSSSTPMNSLTDVSIRHEARCLCNGCPADSTCNSNAACLACLARCRTCYNNNTECHGISECVPEECQPGTSRLLDGTCLNCSVPANPPSPVGGLGGAQVPMFKLYTPWECTSVSSPSSGLGGARVPMFKLHTPWECTSASSPSNGLGGAQVPMFVGAP
jgi:hypothetical protein